MTNVTPKSFVALLAMFTQTHYSYEPLAEVRFSGHDARTLNPEQLLMLGEDLLNVPQGLPFPVNFERVDGKGLEISFEFTEKLKRDRFQEFSEALSIWDYLRMLGAFQLDFSEAKELPPLGRTVWIGPQTVEHSVPHFSENRAALGALLNPVRWQHLRGMQLSSLTIR